LYQGRSELLVNACQTFAISGQCDPSTSRCRISTPATVAYLETLDDTPGQWSGACTAKNVYSVRWPIDCIAPRFRPLMGAQVVVHLAGGISEAIFRGERCQGEVLRLAEGHCCVDDDLTKATDVLAELRRLTESAAHLLPNLPQHPLAGASFVVSGGNPNDRVGPLRRGIPLGHYWGNL
jgi:hypothetical protein